MVIERVILLSPTAMTSKDGVKDVINEVSKAPRLPRWTRQEILVLIQGKRVAENRVRRDRTGSGSAVEPKWASVSSYCKRHGVNRGPVQCRKRWSNLAGDYKKIKEWELNQSDESFWIMRSDLRRDRKLPGFFDKEVYDILDGGVVTEEMTNLTRLEVEDIKQEEEEEEEEEENEVVFDSGRSAATEDGLFSDEETPPTIIPIKEGGCLMPAPNPISEKQYQPYVRRNSNKDGTPNVKNPPGFPEVVVGSGSQQEGLKRKRSTTDEDHNLHDQLIEVMKMNGQMLNTQLEAQNNNLQLDREQRNDHAGTLVAVLNKLADALVRIADKL